MTLRTSGIAASSAIALMILASPSFAGAPTEAHAYQEGQRTLSDGQVEPQQLRQPGSTAANPVAPLALADQQFLFELSRTDGNAQPQPDGGKGGESSFRETAQALGLSAKS